MKRLRAKRDFIREFGDRLEHMAREQDGTSRRFRGLRAAFCHRLGRDSESRHDERDERLVDRSSHRPR